MFEDLFESRGVKDQRVLAQMEPLAVRARRLAAGILVCNVLAAVVLNLISLKKVGPLPPLILSLAVAYHLYKLRPGAETVACVFAILTAVGGPIILFVTLPPVEALLRSARTLGVMVPILLLLTGQAGADRQFVAMTLFVVLACGLDGLGLVAFLVGR